jgi:4-amino-4-deoxy-L-arabinose transferase-like glycosyltransferase
MRNPNSSRLIISIVLFISIALLASLTLFKNVEKTEFNRDESGWISSGYYFSNLLLEGDFEWQRWWKCLPQCGSWSSWYNPHLGQWVIGIPLKIFTAKGEQEFNNFYIFEKSLEENKKEGNIPPQHILIRARSVSAVIGILCCLMIFAIGYYFNNFWIGSIAAILLIFNDLFITLSTQAMTDIPYNFFLLCACLASIFLLRQSRLRYILLISFLCGGLIGLASSVKITGFLVGSLYFFLVIFYKKLICNLEVKDVIKCLATFSVSALFIIYLLNPYFWPSLDGISVRETQEVVTYSKGIPEASQGKEIQKENIGGEHPQLSNFSRVLEFPLMFGRWRRLMDDQLKENKAAQWGENRLRTFHETFVEESSSFPKESYVLVLGVILLGGKLIISLYRGKVSESAVPILYFGANYVFILLFMRVNFDRYYFPTVIASKIIVATVIYEAIKLVWVILRRSTKLISVQRQ